MATRTGHPLQRLTRVRHPAFWLGLALVATGLTALAYVSTHGHPAFEGGMYLQIVEQIRTEGYALPSRISYYTHDGLPFAYPPLLFYVLAVMLDLTGIDPVQLMVVLPGVFVLAYLVPYYLVAEELLEDPRLAGVATVLFGVAPPVLRWHLSAGGVVRAPAMALLMAGTYAGIKLFRDGDWRWLVPSGILWTLEIVTHPVYATFFGWTFLLLYLWYDRSLRGLLGGAVVAISGLTFTAPWWLTVIARHGVDVFVTATHSRATLGGGLPKVIHHFEWPFMPIDAISPIFALVFGGLAYGIFSRRWFLSAWVLTGIYLLGQWRFTFIGGSMLAAVLVFEAFVPVAHRLGEPIDRRQGVAVGVVALVILSATGVGMAFAASDLDAAHVSSPTMPQTVDEQDKAAFEWVEGHTNPDAEFVVMADVAEWFPYYTDRTILVSPWGTEWTSEYRTQLQTYLVMSSCQNLACMEDSMARAEGSAEYLWVPTHEYTVEGQVHPAPQPLIDDLVESDSYRLRYANGGVMIFEHVHPGSTIRASSGPTTQQHTGGMSRSTVR